MDWVSAVLVYIVTWWVVLFAVLPWRVTPARQKVEGAMAGAPENPYLLEKAFWTTAIAAIVFAGIYTLVASDLISFQAMAEAMDR